uniref:Cilia- and flagella-associated protein 91 n=1 Tax=Nothobranchius furzeri TaxID=105023 RepID=A0A8C6NNB2_NOTFU
MDDSMTAVAAKKKTGYRMMPERPYDYLYDPVYTVSSKVNYTRANFMNKHRSKLVPELKSMFSDSPRFTVKVESTDPMPGLSKDDRNEQNQQHRDAPHHLSGSAPSVQTNPKTEECRVTGADRWKYFKCPLVTFSQYFPPGGNFALSRDFVTTEEDNEQQPTQHNVRTQTDYRESETQTDPFSPEYVHQPGITPSELLQLAKLTSGHGLPAGLAEVEMIERMRAKRAWEATLPPVNDLSQLDKRVRMMKEMEAKEWAFREQEIQKLQEARSALLMYKQREQREARMDSTNERINHFRSQLLKQQQVNIQKIEKDHLRVLRKLDAKRENVEGKLKRRDIVLGALKRKDRFPNRFSSEFKSHYLDTYEGLEKLEASLKPLMKHPKPKDVLKPSVNKPLELLISYKAQIQKEKEQITERSPHFIVEKENPVTPRVEGPSEEEEQTELAVIVLQKLLRGRSIQYQMFKNTKDQMANIQELRLTHAFRSKEQDQIKVTQAYERTMKKLREQEAERIAQEEAAQDMVIDREIGELLDTLSKELTRLQEERRIHAFILLAVRQRRQREAEERGRRQQEERRCQEEDEIFRQVVQVHQETLDMYLEDTILENLQVMVDKQAREEIQKKAKKLNDIVIAMEESRDSLQSEEITSEMIYGFLIPEPEKILIQQKVHMKQQQHLQAARRIIEEAASSSRLSPQEPSEQSVSVTKAANQVQEDTAGQQHVAQCLYVLRNK